MTGKLASIVVLGGALAFITLVTQTSLGHKATTAGAVMLHQAGQAMLQSAGSPAALRVSFNR